MDDDFAKIISTKMVRLRILYLNETMTTISSSNKEQSLLLPPRMPTFHRHIEGRMRCVRCIASRGLVQRRKAKRRHFSSSI